ncbi:MAG: hypothetical protein Faunusvirus5_4 [Faunusvirus sp.]|jgi:ankyrin repeat protein|uniref:Uncharacterized protein n=1 Tax=Faunusvirus sp. TaxID=2487766 RepID=A0A3G4ZWD0_9VIRU|nr:MAG: hypothetical protein Faunusvirus5_4 [Faunusvirus sp.]
MLSYVKQIYTDLVYGSADKRYREFMHYLATLKYDKCIECLDQHDDFIFNSDLLTTVTGHGNTRLTRKLIDVTFKLPVDKIHQLNIMNALFVAVINDFREIAGILIDKIGVLQKSYPARYYVNMTDGNSYTLLQYATLNTMYKTIRQLVNIGADINNRDIHGRSLLLIVCSTSQSNIMPINMTIMQYLIKKGVDISVCDTMGKSIYDYAQEIMPLKYYLTTRYKNAIIDTANYASSDNALYMCFARCYVVGVIDIITTYVV